MREGKVREAKGGEGNWGEGRKGGNGEVREGNERGGNGREGYKNIAESTNLVVTHFQLMLEKCLSYRNLLRL